MTGRFTPLLVAHPEYELALSELAKLGGAANANRWLNSHPDLARMRRTEKAAMTRKLKDAGYIRKDGFEYCWQPNSKGIKQSMRFTVWRLVRHV